MRWWSVLVVLVALVVAVVLVRPGTQAQDESIVLPLSDVVAELDVVDAVAVGPSDLRFEMTIGDVALSPAGVGPLRLGQRQGDLAEAGWTFRYSSGGCLRVAPTTVGEVAFSGWVVDGLLVSAQVEMTKLLGRTSPTALAFSFGRPVAEADDFDRQVVVVGAGGAGEDVEVGVGTRSMDGADVLVSDLGTYGVRFAEVRLSGAPDCVVDAGGLGESELPTASAVSSAFVEGLEPGAVGPEVEMVGMTLEQLRAPASPWAGAAAGSSSAGCERLEAVTSPGTTELSLRDGVVTGQRYVASVVVEPERPGTWSVDRAGALVQRSLGEFGRGGGIPPGAAGRLGVTGAYTYTAKVVTLVDTAVVTTEPLLLEEVSGDVCD